MERVNKKFPVIYKICDNLAQYEIFGFQNVIWSKKHMPEMPQYTMYNDILIFILIQENDNPFIIAKKKLLKYS